MSLEYLAGFFDGEGCITIGSNGGVTISVVNTNKKILEMFEFEFNGTLSDRKQKINKKQYQWRAYGNDAYKFLILMEGLLIDKGSQLATALEYLENKEKYQPDRTSGKKGSFANPERNTFIKEYRTILTKQKLGINIERTNYPQ